MTRALLLLPLLLLLIAPAAARADDFQPVVQPCVSGSPGRGCPVLAGFNGAWDVALSPDGRSAYVAAFDADAVVVMDRDAATGALSKRSCVNLTGTGGCALGRALDEPSDIVVTPDGRQVYVASANSGVAVFDRQPDGSLAQKAGQDGCLARSGAAGGCRAVNGIDSTVGSGPFALRLSPGAGSGEPVRGHRRWRAADARPQWGSARTARTSSSAAKGWSAGSPSSTATRPMAA